MFQLNKTLLQVLQERKSWERLWGSIHPDRFDKEVRVVLESINTYWRKHDNDRLDPEVFTGKFFGGKVWDDDERTVYTKIFEVMQQEPDQDTAREIIRDLRTMEFNKEVEDAQTRYVLGDDIDIYEEVRSLTNEFEADVRLDADTGYCTANIEDIITMEETGSVLKWGLDCLNGSMPRTCTGKQIIVAAEPGAGKTSFLADSCLSFYESPILANSDRPIVWFNNEGRKEVIKGTFYRSALRRSYDQIKSLGWSRAIQLFNESIGGPDRLRIYDIHNRDYNYIERIMDNDSPAVCVFDMLDAVGGTPGRHGECREDERLEALYQWARGCAVKYDFLSLPTSQVSVEGHGLQWIPQSALKNSKVGKQGACDAIITIGRDPDPRYETSRFMYIPKTKFTPADGHSASCQTEVVFDAPTARYLNPKRM